MASSAAPEALTDLPNVGPAVARKLVRLGIAAPGDLRGQDPNELFARLCALDGRPHDPCLLDTFTAVVDHAGGAPARPWWECSRERKARDQAAKTSAIPSGSSTASAAPSRVDVRPAS